MQVPIPRAVQGLQQVDTADKRVQLRFTNSRLDWCEGRMPTVDGSVQLRWRNEGGKRLYQVAVPLGYAIRVENRRDLEAVRQP